MKVFYSPYKLTPLKKANRLSSLEKKSGVLLKGVLGNVVTFADYFPHLPLGDRHCDEFLPEFKFQKHRYDKKVFDFLLREHKFKYFTPKKFMNHELWNGVSKIQASVIKYKLQDLGDRSFLSALEKGHKVRLDANGLFQRSQYFEFIKDIPQKFHLQIEYIEDPLAETDWKDLKIPSARDFIAGVPCEYFIHKPNCQFRPETEEKIIYSSYLGHDLGRWHSYSELIEKGDLSLTHGIVTSGFYEDEKPFWTGTYHEGFIASKTKVEKLYKMVSDLNWKSLCSM